MQRRYGDLRRLGLKTIQDQDIIDIIIKAIEQAKEGDKDARRDVLDIVGLREGKLRELSEQIEGIEEMLGIKREGVTVRDPMKAIIEGAEVVDQQVEEDGDATG